MRKAGLPAWAVVLAAVSLVFVAGPVLALLIRADWPTVPGALATDQARQALGLTGLTAVISTLCCVILGVPAALVLSRCSPFLAGLMRAIGLIPLVLPPMVSGVVLLYWLGRRGLAGQFLQIFGLSLPYTTLAVIIAQTFVALPFLIVAVEGALRSGDGQLERVAASLGASPTRVFWTVTWPVMWPSLRGGMVLCFARAVGEFGATALFAGSRPGVTQTMPLAIYTAFNSGLADGDVAIALSVVLVAGAVILLAASGRLGGSEATVTNRSGLLSRWWTRRAVRRAQSRPGAGPTGGVAGLSGPAAAVGDIDANIWVTRGSFSLGARLRAEAGQKVGVIGPNGSGKSTILSAIAGHLPVDAGLIRLAGAILDSGRVRGSVWVPPHRRAIGWLGAGGLVFPHLSVRANVAYGLRAARLNRREVAWRTQEVLERFGLTELADQPAAWLSTGQQCRTALARAFAGSPSVLLLDEPFSGLDVAAASQLRRLVGQLAKERGTTVVVVSHDLVDLTSLADRVVVMEAGQVVDDRPTDQVLLQPRSQFVADLAGATVLEAQVTERGVVTPLGLIEWAESSPVGSSWAQARSYPIGTEVRLAIPPEGFRVVDAPTSAGWSITVGDIAMSEAGLAVTAAGVSDVRIHLPRSTALEAGVRPGNAITVLVDVNKLMLYRVESVMEASRLWQNETTAKDETTI